MEEPTKKNMKAVFTIIDRGQAGSIWVRVGIGFINRDGSLNLKLDAIPVNGQLQVREWDSGDRRYEPVDQGERRHEFHDPSARPRLPPRDKPTDNVI
jgi:hypothetical protein